MAKRTNGKTSPRNTQSRRAARKIVHISSRLRPRERSEQRQLQEPKSPMPKQHQKKPGIESKMRPHLQDKHLRLLSHDESRAAVFGKRKRDYQHRLDYRPRRQQGITGLLSHERRHSHLHEVIGSEPGRARHSRELRRARSRLDAA